MSRSVDNRVVEMEFDNAKFEKGVSQSLSTLDKLKAALSFKHADDDFEHVEGAADKLGKSFSALEAVAVGALMNIGSKVADWAAKTIKELSGVENVMEGFKKFGDITKSSATLAAQGFSDYEIETQLKRLNWFTDETSYNLTDMVDNISKFTASGQGLTESANAMQGIALWAALSGQNAGTASRAMYQLSQAMGSGYMRLEDWKSIQNANMDTDEFRQHVLDAAVALKTLKKNADGTYQSLIEGLKKEGGEAFTKSQFTKNLTSGMWFTKDVMMAVYKEYAKGADEIYEYIQNHAGATVDDALEALGDSLDEFGKKAFEAGQRARTWEDAIESVKDALSTKWMNIFQLIFGGYQQATDFFTDLSYAFYDMFVEPMSRYVTVFERWDEEGGAKLLRGNIVEALYAINDLITDVREAFDDFFYWDPIGSSGQKALYTAAKQKREADAILAAVEAGEYVDESKIVEAEKLQRRWRELADQYHLDYDNADEEDLKENFLIGQRTERIKKFSDGFATLTQKLKTFTEDTSVFRRILNGVFAVVDIIKQAVKGVWDAAKPFRDTFWSGVKKGLGVLASVGDWLVDFRDKLKANDTFKKFFEGFFTPFVTLKNNIKNFYNTLLPKFKERFGDLSAVSEGVGESFGKIKGVLKDIFTSFSNWWKKLFTNFNPEKAVNLLFNAVDKIKKAFYDITGIEPGTLGDKIQNGLDKIQKSLEKFRDEAPEKISSAWEKIKGWFDTAFSWIKEHWEGIANTIKTVWAGVWSFISGIWEGVKGLFKKDSEDGSSSMQGIIDTFKTFGEVIGNLIEVIGKGLKPLADGLKNTLENMSLEGAGSALAGGGLAAIGAAILKFAKGLRKSNVLIGINEVLSEFGDVLNSFSHVLDAKALKEAAVAVAILVGSLFVLMSMPADQLGAAVLAFSAIITVLAKAMSQLDGITSSMKIDKNGFSRDKNSAGMMFLEMAAGLLLIAFALKAIAKIPLEELETALVVISIIVAVMVAAVKALSKLYANKGDTNKVYNKNSGNNSGNKLSNNSINSIIKMGGPAATILSFALMLWVVAKVIGKISDMITHNLAGFQVGLLVVAAVLIAMAAIAKKLDGVQIGSGVTKAIIAFAAALYVIALAIDKVASISDPIKMGLASVIIFAMLALMGGIIIGVGDKDLSSIGSIAKGLISFAIAIAAIAVVIYELSKLSVEELAKGGVTVAAIGLLLAGLAWVSTWKKFDPNKFRSMAKSMVILAAAIGIVAVIIYALAQLNDTQLQNGIIGLVAAVAAISALAIVASKTGDGMEKVGKVFIYIAGGAALLAIGFLAIVKALEILSGDTVNIKKAFDKISDMIDAFIDKLPEWLAKISIAIIGFVDDLIANVIVEFVNHVYDLIEKFKENDTITKLVNGFIDVACMVIDAVTARAKDIITSVGNFIVAVFRETGDWLNNNRDEVKRALDSFVSGVIGVFLELFDGTGYQIFHAITGEGEEEWNNWKDDAKDELVGWVETLAGLMVLAMAPVSNKVLGIIALVTTTIALISKLVNTIDGINQAEEEKQKYDEAYANNYIAGKPRDERIEGYIKSDWEKNHQDLPWDTYHDMMMDEFNKKGIVDYLGDRLVTTSMAREYWAINAAKGLYGAAVWDYYDSMPAGAMADELGFEDLYGKNGHFNNGNSYYIRFDQNIYGSGSVNPIDTYRGARNGVSSILDRVQTSH